MKKAYFFAGYLYVSNVSLLVICFFCLCLLGCGLDVVYYINPPTVCYNTPSYSTEDYTLKYFSFRTEEDSNTSGDFTFDGTGVYYKIYNNYSTMVARNNAITAVNTNSNTSEAAVKMIESYGYKPLGTFVNGSLSPLIASTGIDRSVYIRLMTYDKASDSSYHAKVIVGSNTDDGSVTYIPMRYGNNYSFDFGRSSSDDFDTSMTLIPASSDDDVVYGSFSSSGTWYVDMYAVGIGHDNSFTQYYSLVLHLGAVPIVAGQKN